MRTLSDLEKLLETYSAADYIYRPSFGYLAWHFSTGGNLEPLYIEVAEKGRGHGKQLYAAMARRLIDQGKEPYHSVFAYRLNSNTVAQRFYDKLGWQQMYLGQCIYKGDTTVLMWIEWERFLEVLGIDRNQQRQRIVII